MKNKISVKEKCSDIIESIIETDDILNIDINDNSSLNLSLIIGENILNKEININLKRNSNLTFNLADFQNSNINFKVKINLIEEHSNVVFNLASLCMNNNIKNFDISVYHKNKFTFANVNSYGVCKDSGKLVFSGESQIFNNSKQSKTNQNAKIIVFDEKANGIAKPILKIDENDVEATHSATVGQVNDDHIFYLMSRGLSFKESKKIITLGYLKPIYNGFNKKEHIDFISKAIEERI